MEVKNGARMGAGTSFGVGKNYVWGDEKQSNSVLQALLNKSATSKSNVKGDAIVDEYREGNISLAAQMLNNPKKFSAEKPQTTVAGALNKASSSFAVADSILNAKAKGKEDAQKTNDKDQMM